MCGVIVNFVRIGHWQGNIESRVDTLEKNSRKYALPINENEIELSNGALEQNVY